MSPAAHLWRRLGEILVGKGLLTEGGLERALAAQRQSGRRLGEILVERGWVSSDELAAALAEQHGVELEIAPSPAGRTRPFASVSPTGGAFRTVPWQPLGRLLVAKGLLTEAGLERALALQHDSRRLLGEILVDEGWVSATDVAETLAEQQGLRCPPRAAMRARARPAEEPQPLAPRYEVRLGGDAAPLHVSATFLDATDLAFDELYRRDPELLEIVKVTDGVRERVWTYDRGLAQPESTLR